MDAVLATVGWFVFAAVIAVTVAPGLLPGRVFLSLQTIGLFQPWSHGWPAITTNVMTWDTVDSAAPMSLLVTEQARAGHGLALWDPYSNGGVMLAALPNAGLLSPLSLPWWVLPARMAPAAVKVLEAVAIALGTHLLLRREWRLARASVPLAALAYFASGFMVAWTNWPQTRVAAFIPLFVWCVDRLASSRGRWRLLCLAVVTASMILGGFPAIIGYTVYFCVPYFLVRSIGASRSPREIAVGLAEAGGGVLLGAGLSAVQLVPFVRMSLTSVDFAARASDSSGALPWETLATSVLPDVFGVPVIDAPSWPTRPVEGLSYVGALVIVAALAGLALRSRRVPRGVMPYLGLTAVVIGSAVYHVGVANAVLRTLPLVSSSPIGRMRSVLAMIVVVMAAVGVDGIVNGAGTAVADVGAPTSRPARMLRRLPMAVRWLCAGTIAVGIAMAAREAVLSVALPEIVRSARVTALGMALMMTAIVLVRVLGRTRLSRAVASGLVAVILLATGLGACHVGREWWPVTSSDEFYPVSAANRYLDDHLHQERYIASDFAMMPGTSTVYRERSVNGHAFSAPQWKELLSAAIPGMYISATYTSAPVGTLTSGAGAPVLDRLGVAYTVTGFEDAVPGQREAATGTVRELDATEAETVHVAGAARGIYLGTSTGLGVADSVTVEAISDASGATLATTTITGAFLGLQNGLVPLALEDVDAQESWHAVITTTRAAGIALGVDAEDLATVDVLRPQSDGLKLVLTDGVLVYRRETALARIRWASAETVITSSTARVQALVDGTVADDAVLLQDPADAHHPTGTSSATVVSRDIDTDRIEIDVDADGAGWVVIDDALQSGGWHATLDGRTAPLVAAEHVGGAIWVGQGQHRIELTYRPHSFVVGQAVSMVSLAIVAVTLVLPGIRRQVVAAGGRRRGTRGSAKA